MQDACYVKHARAGELGERKTGLFFINHTNNKVKLIILMVGPVHHHQFNFHYAMLLIFSTYLWP